MPSVPIEIPSETAMVLNSQMEIAGTDLDPGVGHANQGSGEIGIGQADRLEHRAGRGAVGPVGQRSAAVARIHMCAHRLFSSGVVVPADDPGEPSPAAGDPDRSLLNAG
jgi:hypothetical protein